MENEIWKDIEGYEGLYQISNLGNVKSLPKILKNNHSKYVSKEKYLKQSIGKKGYHSVSLSNNKARKWNSIHRLVAIAFIPNLLNLPQVNHKDENKSNNSVSNLEWCTNEYNENYGTRNQRRSEKLSKRVHQYSKEGELIKNWGSAAKCGEYGYNKSHVSACCRNESKTHKGYIWKYD